MRKIITLLIVCICLTTNVFAKPGDTTIVTITKGLQLTYTGNYDIKTVLPDTSKHYRKVWLIYTIGRYYCAGSPQYCGSWDYNTQLFVQPKNGLDSVEIAHVITPYATTQTTPPNFDSTWHWDYTLDITDFAPLLHDSVNMHYNFGGYSYGFTLGLKMIFIEGTPPREALLVKKAWDVGFGSIPYGVINNPISNYLQPKKFVMPANTMQATLRTKITGHGSDSLYGCGEFCSRYFKVFLNNMQVDSTQIWRTDCGSNSLYPQTGTWLFERGGWCPGAKVNPVFHALNNVTPGDTLTLGLIMQPFVNPYRSSGAHYVVNTEAIFYGQTNFTLDASLEDVKSPSNQTDYFRYNPICSEPVVTIRNTGSTPLTALNINYGIIGDTTQNYEWNGHLNFLDQVDVVLPPLLHYSKIKAGSIFQATINSPNGSPDQYAANNIITSAIQSVAQVWSHKIVVTYRTNEATSQYGNYNETSYQITNASDSVLFSLNKPLNNHTYRDTFNFKPGCYKFVVNNDGCDGIDWWYYAYYTVNPGNGYFSIHSMSPNIYLTPTHLFNGDFGCGFAEEFTVPGYPAATLNEPGIYTPAIRLLNVPANTQCIVASNEDINNVTIEIFDASGRQILNKYIGQLTSFYELNTKDMPSGLYFVHILNQQINTTLKLVVQH